MPLEDNDVIDLLSCSSSGSSVCEDTAFLEPTSNREKGVDDRKLQARQHSAPNPLRSISNSHSRQRKKVAPMTQSTATAVVLQEDLDQATQNLQVSVESYIEQQNESKRRGKQPRLYHDIQFPPLPSSIQGSHKPKKRNAIFDHDALSRPLHMNPNPKCYCKVPAQLSYRRPQTASDQRNPTHGYNFDLGIGGTEKLQCYYHCGKNKQAGNRKCKFFSMAHIPERFQWYRFGLHTGHHLVNDTGFSAQDLVQGQLGTCWFLSALAVVAERPDLILRLFSNANTHLNEYGIVQVNLFCDGNWQTVVMDDFLPCLLRERPSRQHDELDRAVEDSIRNGTVVTGTFITGQRLADGARINNGVDQSSQEGKDSLDDSSNNDEEQRFKDGNFDSPSQHDPHVMTKENAKCLIETSAWLEQDRRNKNRTKAHRTPPVKPECRNVPPLRLGRTVISDDLAYSKAKGNQLWVPFLEKAYARCHGSFQAISGGIIAEAFLNLTGAPTLQFCFDSKDHDPKSFWYKLMSWSRQRLPMGCTVSNSQEGLIGMHAYSLLSVREINNVSVEFFREKLLDNTLGNVSGFTEFDGTVRLLRIRNPHGKGEWKGEWSDKSKIWSELASKGGIASGLERSMRNDGEFWIDYDSFLLGFYSVDVVLAFEGNHAKSFQTSFAAKTSNHRCQRAYEVSLLDTAGASDTVEVYVMIIQKSRRGATRGRIDRKVSYKHCDIGMLIGQSKSVSMAKQNQPNDDDEVFDEVQGHMFGLKVDGHHRLVLDRKARNRVLVMPIHFGDPVATNPEKSFVVRFVASAPLLIRECPPPRMDRVISRFCLFSNAFKNRLVKTLILDDEEGKRTLGTSRYQVVQVICKTHSVGTVFLYLVMNDDSTEENPDFSASFEIDVRCRGMVFRTVDGIQKHETVAKKQRFEAAWRSYKTSFAGLTMSQLLGVVYQSGQDAEFGSAKCTQSRSHFARKEPTTIASYFSADRAKSEYQDRYDQLGIFHPIRTCSLEKLEFVGSPLSQAFMVDLDGDLERALAISRGEAELQEAIERSKSESREFKHVDLTNEVDGDLQRAVALSKRDKTSKENNPSWQYDSRDLEEAIKNSLVEQQRMTPPGALQPEIVDLASDSDCEIEVITDSQQPAKEPEVVELLEEVQVHAQDHENCFNSKRKDLPETSMDSERKRRATPSLEEKRRLTAEAAAHRFGGT